YSVFHGLNLMLFLHFLSEYVFFFFFFQDTAPTEIYTLSYTTLFRSELGAASRLQFDAVDLRAGRDVLVRQIVADARLRIGNNLPDRKSTRLNSSHLVISYAVFCLKKKKYIRTAVHIASNDSAQFDSS